MHSRAIGGARSGLQLLYQLAAASRLPVPCNALTDLTAIIDQAAS